MCTFNILCIENLTDIFSVPSLYVCMYWVLCKAVLWESVLVASEILLMLREFSDHVLA